MKDTADPLTHWEIEQLLKLRERRPGLLLPAIRRLMHDNADIRWALVVGAYQDAKVNFGKTAEQLGLAETEQRLRFSELGIPLRVGSVDLAEAQAEAETTRLWFAGDDD